MSSTINAFDVRYQSMMSSLQHSLGAASIMSPPSTSSVSMSSHPIHRPQHSVAIQSSMSAGTCTDNPAPPSHRRPQRNVRFNDQISGVIVPSLDDMSMKERQNVWYSVSFVSSTGIFAGLLHEWPQVRDQTFSLHISNVHSVSIQYHTTTTSLNVQPQEKAQMQENLKNEAKHMRRCMSHSASPESDQTSARGIEHLASGVILRNLDSAKTAVIHAVLHEQHHQRMAYGSANVDQVRLAMTSSELSLDARKRAIVLAASDQDFVLCEQ